MKRTSARVASIVALASAAALPAAACRETSPAATSAGPPDAPALLADAPAVNVAADAPPPDGTLPEGAAPHDAAIGTVSDARLHDAGYVDGSCGPKSTSQCTICSEQFCCPQFAACLSDPDCNAYIVCGGDCKEGGQAVPDGSPCLAACGAAHPAGRAELDTALACQRKYCGNSGC